ncbi:guanine nucleotide exchange factor C9orf72 homolog isoform X2 [Falco biarmicus]|uniref:guanine nucleotide exchange factor C9orf72 homolog isoform X2 n=1 Tax=Falco cherrug TaxID=345164 RepID=UPI00067992DD|nr:guanine nucleotide exchange factor C9orf72 homolog isoform X2 [Falco cherrug]XP_055646996.1 guanine nucleotide exchange factor C9orf72 homolog isoform X2 [Falco peregrinus]XP_056180817.1 guanine nucleotide exchange factor C9orf72 homolog isoform X2 [Falco biarmicus]
MSALCPPPSPAVAKTEISLNGESPLLAATFAYWDNILGPRVRHIWAPKTEQVLLSDGEITFLANHTLNGEILRNAESGAIDVKFFVLAEKRVIIVSLIFDGNWNGDRSTYGLSIILPQSELGFYLPLHRVCVDRLTHIIRKGRIWMHKGRSIIPMLTGEVIPVMELLSSMKSHSVPEEIDISDTVLNDDDIGDSCHEGFLLNAISSHLQTCGCSVVVGSSAEKVNKIVRTLCLFLTPSERKCSRLCRNESSFKYESGLFVQGLLKDATGSFVLPFRQVMYAPYPTTHIDVDVNTVKQMPPCHEHIYNQRRYMRSELTAFWRANSDEEMSQDHIIHTDESFTPDLNVFQDILHRDTLVKAFLDQIFHLKPGLSLRSTFLAQFLLVLHRKALTLIKYIEDDTQKGKKPFRSLRSLKMDLDLAAEGDLNIVMALAEKIKPGLHSFVFGRPFYTSIQERDMLMTF